MDKKQVRKYVKEKKKLLTPEYVKEYSGKLSELFCETEAYKKSAVILSYLAYNTEIDTNEIIKKAWSDGKTIAVPRVTGEGQMEFFKITSFDETEIGFCGIPEPKTEVDDIPNFTEALMIMPGLAFGRDHSRIGYGGGYYDRYIEREEKRGAIINKISLAYDFQIFDTLETEEHDKRVDLVISLDEIF